MKLNKSMVTGLFFCIASISCPVYSFDQVASDKKVEDKSFSDRLEDLKIKALLAAGSAKVPAVPRLVSRGARSEMIIKGEVIYFNGVGLRIGDSLAYWKKTLSVGAQCGTGDGITVCVWDDWGIEVGTNEDVKPKVEFINIFLNFVDVDGNDTGKVNTSFGKSGRSKNDKELRLAFSGYLELDGFGIDSKTKFWEIKASTKDKRGLKCGLLDCSHPAGIFGNRARIFLTLNGNDDNATVRQFSISAESYK